MKKNVNTFLSVIYWIFIVITALIFFPLYLITYLLTFGFDERRIIAHHFTRFWALFYLYINPWIEFVIEGLEKIDKRKTYIVICNHQSMLDIFILYLLPLNFRWISKIEIFRIPIVGLVMKLNKYIPLERGNKESISKMYSCAEDSLRDGVSIIIFPEGTRSEDGKLKKFKEGAFHLSYKTGKNILLVIIDKAYTILPKNSIFFEKRNNIKVRIIDEMPAIRDINNINNMINIVEEIYKREIEKMRKEE